MQSLCLGCASPAQTRPTRKNDLETARGTPHPEFCKALLNRAALNLESCRWSFDGDTLRVESATNSGDFYTVTVEVCPCSAGKAGKPCWHRAGCRLLCKAAEMDYTAATTNGYQDAPARPFEDAKPTMAELQAAADELFA